MSRIMQLLAATLLLALLTGEGAKADVVITVSKMRQSMSVSVNGMPRYSWRVSTGVNGTPSGTFRPQYLDRDHRSARFHNAPMPYSIFYDGNFAIHGTNAVSQLGGPASHGCVRLHPSNAATLYALVQSQGLSNTRIIIQQF